MRTGRVATPAGSGPKGVVSFCPVIKEYEKPDTINTDKAPSYDYAIRELKEQGLLNDHLFHRKVKYLNNLIEADHGKLKRLIKPTLGFQSMKTAYATIKGFEVMLLMIPTIF